MTMSKTRTFIALGASGEVVGHAQRIVKRLRKLAHDIKWVEPHHLHWTLHFLGEVADDELFALCQAAERATLPFDEFTMEARGVGAFPRAEAPRTLWIGVGRGTQEVQELHASLDVQLKPLGFRGENRRYVPHLTLGRVGKLSHGEQAALAEALGELADYDAGVQMVDEVTIFGSRLRREGTEYVELGYAMLGGE
jgi:RNA 2',3'-cyclic 3'-phosphodiesterase